MLLFLAEVAVGGVWRGGAPCDGEVPSPRDIRAPPFWVQGPCRGIQSKVHAFQMQLVLRCARLDVFREVPSALSFLIFDVTTCPSVPF